MLFFVLILASDEIPLCSRKRKRNESMWKQNKRKDRRNHGLSYTSINGKEVTTKKMGPTCLGTCFHGCTKNISEEKRQRIFSYFWSLSPKEKKVFYGNFIKKTEIKRRRKKSIELTQTKKKSSFNYFFIVNEITLQVCKKYFLNTLAISERVVYYFFEHNYQVESSEILLNNSKKGRKKTENRLIEEVKDHITSFPCIDSHYCRASTSKKYLESHLNVAKMYDLYKTTVNNPVSIHIYRHTFNTSFNLSFHTPKKDLCDKCSHFKVNSAIYSE